MPEPACVTFSVSLPESSLADCRIACSHALVFLYTAAQPADKAAITMQQAITGVRVFIDLPSFGATAIVA
ncbi:hypothetical protein PPGU19_012500 [Paraburkholderia sp. PGU19]|nr:hypothetical protein PPGU19_012500 [Paraburkholderia sp. PGU19]